MFNCCLKSICELTQGPTLKMAKVSNTLKLVPEKVEDITTNWSDDVLHEGKCISSDVKVANIEVNRLTNESSDISDGGGLSGSMMVKINLTYR